MPKKLYFDLVRQDRELKATEWSGSRTRSKAETQLQAAHRPLSIGYCNLSTRQEHSTKTKLPAAEAEYRIWEWRARSLEQKFQDRNKAGDRNQVMTPLHRTPPKLETDSALLALGKMRSRYAGPVDWLQQRKIRPGSKIHGKQGLNQRRNKWVTEPKRAAGIENEHRNPNLGPLKTKWEKCLTFLVKRERTTGQWRRKLRLRRRLHRQQLQQKTGQGRRVTKQRTDRNRGKNPRSRKD
jgi:hypothetical protein